MKLLLDQNLSPKLTQALTDLFPGSTRVRDCGLGEALDR
jgi:predicted nuclease of predicted toxin-antitoxin system